MTGTNRTGPATQTDVSTTGDITVPGRGAILTTATDRGIGAIPTTIIAHGIGTDRGMEAVGTATMFLTTADMPIHAPTEYAISVAAISAENAPVSTLQQQGATSMVQYATSAVRGVLLIAATSVAGATQIPITIRKSTVSHRRSAVRLAHLVEAVRSAVPEAEVEAVVRTASRLEDGVDVCGTANDIVKGTRQ